MKTQFLNLVFAVIILSITNACQSDVTDLTKAVITGTINSDLPLQIDEIKVNLNDSRSFRGIYYDSIDENGRFRIEIDLYKAQDIEIKPLFGVLIVHPGDNIHLDIDLTKTTKESISGDAKRSNQDLHDYFKRKFALQNRSTVRLKTDSLELYIDACKNVRKKMLIARDHFITTVHPTQEVIEWTKDYIEATYYTNLLNYMSNFTKSDAIKYQISENFFDLFDAIKISQLFNSDVLQSKCFRILKQYTFLFHVAPFYKEKTNLQSNADSVILYSIVNGYRYSPTFKSYLISNITHETLTRLHLSFYDKYKPIIQENINIWYLRQQIEEDFQLMKTPTINFPNGRRR